MSVSVSIVRNNLFNNSLTSFVVLLCWKGVQPEMLIHNTFIVRVCKKISFG